MPIQRLLQLVEDFTFSGLWRRLTKIKAVFKSDVQQAAESCADDKTEFLPGVPLSQNQASQNFRHPCAIHAGDGSRCLCSLKIKTVRSNTN